MVHLELAAIQLEHLLGASVQHFGESFHCPCFARAGRPCVPFDHVGMGQLVTKGLPVPAADSLRLKDPAAWRYIGKPRSIVDLKDIVRGKAVYGLDMVVPGMKYASIERCPVYGGKVKWGKDVQEVLESAAVVDPNTTLRVKAVETAYDSVGVDTPEDLEHVRRLLAAPTS